MNDAVPTAFYVLFLCVMFVHSPECGGESEGSEVYKIMDRWKIAPVPKNNFGRGWRLVSVWVWLSPCPSTALIDNKPSITPCLFSRATVYQCVRWPTVVGMRP